MAKTRYSFTARRKNIPDSRPFMPVAHATGETCTGWRAKISAPAKAESSVLFFYPPVYFQTLYSREVLICQIRMRLFIICRAIFTAWKSFGLSIPLISLLDTDGRFSCRFSVIWVLSSHGCTKSWLRAGAKIIITEIAMMAGLNFLRIIYTSMWDYIRRACAG